MKRVKKMNRAPHWVRLSIFESTAVLDDSRDQTLESMIRIDEVHGIVCDHAILCGRLFP